MRARHFLRDGVLGVGVWANEELRGVLEEDPAWPGCLDDLVGGDLHAALLRLMERPRIEVANLTWLPPILRPGKILCIGLNYADHTAEVAMEQPTYPTVFGRFASSLMGHEQPCPAPRTSLQLDYEGELALIIGRRGRDIPREDALLHVAGWALFNDISVRDYQFKSTQWTVGKNWDATGAFGPDLVLASDLPPNAKGLTIRTRLNGAIMQEANTGDMIFKPDVLVSTLSHAMTLEPGDVIVTGTPAGVGMGRKPPVWMKPGDIVEVEIDRLGVLRTPIVEPS